MCEFDFIALPFSSECDLSHSRALAFQPFSQKIKEAM